MKALWLFLQAFRPLGRESTADRRVGAIVGIALTLLTCTCGLCALAGTGGRESPSPTPILMVTEEADVMPRPAPPDTLQPSPPATRAAIATRAGPPASVLPTRPPTAVPSATLAPAAIAVTAWVDNSAPAQNSTVTAYGRITRDGAGLASIPMRVIWSYKTATAYCEGVSDDSGTASCTRDIGRATKGFKVAIRVIFTYGGQTYEAVTSFVPQ